ILESPFDVAPRAVNLLALQGELAQRSKLGVVEAELVHSRRRQLLLEGTPVRQRADRDAFSASIALQHLARAVKAEIVRYDKTVDHGLTETPTRFDHALIGTCNRIFGKHNAGGSGVEECLDDYANARPSEQTNTLPVGDSRVRVRRPPD